MPNLKDDIDNVFAHLGPLTPDISHISRENSSYYNTSYQQLIFNGGTSELKSVSKDLLTFYPSDMELLEAQEASVSILFTLVSDS